MAALCPGVQYGLSSQQNFGENKQVVFVKLTDSALRAIEDYLKNQTKFSSQSPRIRFGNENGELSVPTQHNGQTTFRFVMSSSADIGGPAGSFECIQGSSPRGPLELLGPIPYKIRVNANDDVYEATRNRMTEVEDKYKNKCTREIKPNQTDIGRKVKVKQSSSSRPPLLSTSQQPRSSMRDSLLKHPTPAPYQPPPPPVTKPPPMQPPVHLSNGLTNGLSSNHVSSSQRSAAVQHSRKPSVPEVARRPLRERLIHLLALRPHKKIELHDRITKEGLRGTSSITTVLKQIACMKDNCFHLNRNIWNEVNEDWPFYTETEKQLVKRHKPQNLTPPGGSDGGSSGSGQSPTSTHPGSPPLISSTNGVGGKRPGYNEGSDGLPYKRQRIAHGGKPAPAQHAAPDAFSYNRSPVEQNSQRRPVTDLRDASNMNPRSRESPNNGYFNSYDNLPPAEDERNKRQCDSANGLTFGVSREKAFRSGSPVNNRLVPDDTRRNTNSRVLQSHSVSNGRDKDRRNNNTKVTSSSQRIARVSPDSQTEGLPVAVMDKSPDLVPRNHLTEPDEFPDFKKLYVTITSPEQKSAYKADFNEDYAEYKNLYPIVEKVSKRFEELQERLNQESENSPRYKDIKKQIVREYQEMKKNSKHQRTKSRFQYLHEKLSHIKRLVSDYQAQAIDC
ncbi:hypothetical protein GWI33_005432 [Rhynchophorus ferrugineus]|uniref:OCEL domain-containing protein n=1 Tax=Rhynchophorus ferrugineus TaxID=354439 RepID=A0A834IHJ2_RHYFE|nr:hypothetical protein GWI33_005432 [Rhynchophorus ferrugineus]